MVYVKDMVEREKESELERIERLSKYKNIQKIILRANHHISKDEILALKGTKALVVETMCNTDNEYDNRQTWGEIVASAHGSKMCADVTTWSSVIRSVMEILKPTLKYVFSIAPDSDDIILTFKACLENVCERTGTKLNSNCPKRLFKESEEFELIKSSVYINNKNHMIKVLDDEEGNSWYFCAVYTDEIIVMIEALLDTIYSIMEEYSNYKDKIGDFPHHTIVITCADREGETEEVVVKSDSDMVVNRDEFIKDLAELESIKIRINSFLDGYITDLERRYNISFDEVYDAIWKYNVVK